MLHALARGDLGNECNIEDLPNLQKRIIKECIAGGRPVITATQMFESMISSPAPTRAEVSDVANAIFDGTSAVMLSGETAAGAHPVESVRVMATLALEAEASGAADEGERKDLEQVLYYESYIVTEPGDTPLELGEVISEDRYRECVQTYGAEFAILFAGRCQYGTHE